MILAFIFRYFCYLQAAGFCDSDWGVFLVGAGARVMDPGAKFSPRQTWNAHLPVSCHSECRMHEPRKQKLICVVTFDSVNIQGCQLFQFPLGECVHGLLNLRHESLSRRAPKHVKMKCHERGFPLCMSLRRTIRIRFQKMSKLNYEVPQQCSMEFFAYMILPLHCR